MISIEEKLLLIFLDDPELKTDDDLLIKYKGVYGKEDDGKEVYETIKSLSRNNQLVSFDPEYDALGSIVSITHKEHGELDISDLDWWELNTYLALGAKAFPTIFSNLDGLAEVAADKGLKNALAHFQNLPIDSSAWSGLPQNFAFTPQVQSKVVNLLRKAQIELERIDLTNKQYAKASGYIDCALIMAESPEPEPDMIALMVRRLLIIVGAVGLFADLKGIFE